MTEIPEKKTWHSRLPFFYGWIAIFTAGLTIFFTGPGQTYSFSLFINQFIEEFGWSRSSVSTLYTVATTISGLTMFMMGRVVDRIGAKIVTIAASVILVAACFWSSYIISPFMLFIGFFLGRFSGQGVMSLAGGTFAPRWFVKKRALAIMLAGLGGTLASITFPLLNNYLINEFGWRIAFRSLGIFVAIGFIPLSLLLMKNKPEDLGMLPDGVPLSDKHAREADLDEKNSLTQSQALRTAAFYILGFSILQFSMVGTGIAFHFVSIFNEMGFTQDFAAKVMSISPVSGFLAVVGTSILMDKMKKPHYLLAGVTFTAGILYVLLAYIDTAFMAYVYTILIGAVSSSFMLTHAVLKPYIFGRRYIGGIAGILAVMGVVGSGAGPMPFGLAFDYFGGYKEILLIMAVLPIVSGVLTLFLKKPKGNSC